MSARRLLRLFLLLLGSCYLNTGCHPEGKDARTTYARGIAKYVTAPVEVTVTALVGRATAPRFQPIVARQGTRSQQRPSLGLAYLFLIVAKPRPA